MRRCYAALIAVALVPVLTLGQEGPKAGSFGPAQAMADVIRSVTGTDIALIPAMMVKSESSSTNLARLVNYPGDFLSVSELTGSQIRAALNRSLSLYPSPNNGFLQVSGIEVTFNPAASSGSRVVSVLVGGAKLDDEKVYAVGMPISLAKGNYGYLNIWDKKAIKKTLEGTTLEQALEGLTGSVAEPRWKIVG